MRIEERGSRGQVYFFCILFLCVKSGTFVQKLPDILPPRFSEVSCCPRKIARRWRVRPPRREGMDFFRVPVFGKRHDQILGYEFQPFYCLAAILSEDGRFPVLRLRFFLVCRIGGHITYFMESGREGDVHKFIS